MRTAVFDGTTAFRTKTFNLSNRKWSSTWLPTFTGGSTPTDAVQVPIRWRQANSSGSFDRHDVFLPHADGSETEQSWTYHPVGSSFPAIPNLATHVHDPAFFAKTGFPQSGPSEKNLFGTEAPGHNLYTPSAWWHNGVATRMYEHYWSGSGWATYDRGDFGSYELLLGPEGAEWSDHEALVCVSLPTVEVACLQHFDNKWQTVELSAAPFPEGLNSGRYVTALQAPLVVRYVKDEDVYFRVFVLGWEEGHWSGDEDHGVWKLYSIERPHGDASDWGSEAGQGSWVSYGAAPNVATNNGEQFPSTKDAFAYSLEAWAAFDYDENIHDGDESTDSWVNLYGQDQAGENIVDFYFDATTRTWQWGSGQPAPSYGYRVSSAIAQVDPQGHWRASAFGSSPNGVFERYFDTARGASWTFLHL